MIFISLKQDIWQFIEIRFNLVIGSTLGLAKILWFFMKQHDTWLTWHDRHSRDIIQIEWKMIREHERVYRALASYSCSYWFFCITLSIWVFNYISSKPFVWLGFHFYWLVAFWIIHTCIHIYAYISPCQGKCSTAEV